MELITRKCGLNLSGFTFKITICYNVKMMQEGVKRKE